MELTSLHYFICVAKQLSFSKAAKLLYVSQPTLSYHISRLEKELGAPLFIRDKRQIFLTEAGQILLEEAIQISEHTDAAVSRIAALSAESADTLRFGFLELLISPCFNQFVSPFLNQNPQFHGVMERCSNPFLLDALLLRSAYDFAFTRAFLCDLYGQPDNLSRFTVMKDAFAIIIPKNHPCAHLDAISDLSIFNGSKLILLDKIVAGSCYEPCFRQVLLDHGFPASPDYYTHNMDDLLGQVAAGRGISLIPFYSSIDLAFNGAKLIRLEGDNIPCADVVLAWNNETMTRQKQEFLAFIRQKFPK